MNPSKKVRQLVLERDAGSCAWCGRYCAEGSYSLQHRRARGMGGTRRKESNLPANLLVLCGSATTGCHNRVERAPELARHYGYRLSQNESPLAAPVWTARHGWIRLDDFGGIEHVYDPDPSVTASLKRIADVIREVTE